MNTKLKTVEEEKKNLIAAVKILQENELKGDTNTCKIVRQRSGPGCIKLLLLALPYMANVSLGFGKDSAFFLCPRSAEVRLRHKLTDWLQFPV